MNRHEIQLFQLPLAMATPRLEELAHVLSADEWARSTRLRNESRRQALVVGRLAIRSILGAYCGLSPGEIHLSVDVHGKPRQELAGRLGPPCFSISHSPTLVVIGITELEGVGVDVEDLDRPIEVDSLVRGYFTLAERVEWAMHPPEHRALAFFRGWTRKEAAWKFFGSDEVMRWENIEVTLDSSPHTRVRATNASGGAPLTLHCFTWHPTPNSVASIVVQATADELPHFALQPIGFLTDEQLLLRSTFL